MARWLASERNPLAARVTVNRAWQAFFGEGIVRTIGDFGTQGSVPTHPELLDWLAIEFMARGWHLKKLHRLIVTSAAYRLRSTISPQALNIDPQNRLLGRGPRFRVEAEMVRDIALSASGLLAKKVGGPSVFPPQPASATALAYGKFKWRTSKGPSRYRRSLYTFSKRTAAFAAFTVFDAPTGENCEPRRSRSNTPLQALTMLNDPMFLELARALAKEIQSRQESDQDRVRLLFRRCLTRPPTAGETDDLVNYHEKQRLRLMEGDLDPALIAGDKKASAELAAWVMVARVVLNLDETITKQ